MLMTKISVLGVVFSVIMSASLWLLCEFSLSSSLWNCSLSSFVFTFDHLLSSKLFFVFISIYFFDHLQWCIFRFVLMNFQFLWFWVCCLKEFIQFESGWGDFTGHWRFGEFTVHVCFCFFFLVPVFLVLVSLVIGSDFVRLWIVETCRGISLPVKSQMRLAAVLPLNICKTSFFGRVFLCSCSELLTFLGLLNLFSNAGTYLTIVYLETYPSLFQSLRSWSFCKCLIILILF